LYERVLEARCRLRIRIRKLLLDVLPNGAEGMPAEFGMEEQKRGRKKSPT